MKKILTIMVAGFLLLVTRQSIAQSVDIIPIGIGQKLPEHLKSYINQSVSPQVDLFSGTKRLIILDFWCKSCKSSITALPKMQALQDEFNQTIQIVPVTPLSDDEVKSVYAKWFTEEIKLADITGDSLLKKYFPHRGVPHHVWINSEGIVEYITYGGSATSKTIASFLQGKKPKLPYKIELGAIESSKPLWAKENGPLADRIRYYSYVSGWIQDYAGGGITKFSDTVHGSIGIRYWNLTLLSLYKIAYSETDEGLFEDNRRIITDPSSITLFSSDKDNDPDEWNRNNRVCYEISIPKERKHELYTIMQQDLDRYFDYQVRVETRPVKSLCLVRTSVKNKININTEEPTKIVLTDTALDIKSGNLDRSLLGRLREANAGLSTPILNKTGLSGKVAMRLNCSLRDITALRRELKKYDLDLVEEVVPLKMLVIKKKIPAMKP